MKNIGNNIYCRITIYQSAIRASYKTTHLARRLLEGVFTHEALMSCTLTKQAPRSKDKTVNVIMPLNQRAKDAIVGKCSFLFMNCIDCMHFNVYS